MEERTKVAKAYIRGIAKKSDFIALLDDLFITDTERQVAELVYLRGRSMECVASDMQYSVQTIKAIHKRFLLKVSTYIISHS